MYYVGKEDMREWKRICRKYCSLNDLKLVNVYHTCFSAINSKGELIEKTIEDLMEEFLEEEEVDKITPEVAKELAEVQVDFLRKNTDIAEKYGIDEKFVLENSIVMLYGLITGEFDEKIKDIMIDLGIFKD